MKLSKIGAALRRVFMLAEPELPAGREHDYMNRTWGHNVEMGKLHDNGTMSLVGWGPLFGPRIERGDILRLPVRDDLPPRWQITKIEYYRDPNDMWHATLKPWAST